MNEIIVITIAIALCAAFAILLMDKIGFREEVQVRAPRLISEMFSCDFCLSWWTCLVMASVIALLDGNLLITFAAVAATPITRKML